MARPRRSEHTRESIIDQGIDLLSEHGYHGTGLKLILDTVKVPKGSFYNYFESKEQFASEVISVYAQSLLDQFDAYVAQTKDDPKTIIQNVYGMMMDSFDEKGCHKGCLIGNMAAEIGGSSDLCRASMAHTLSAWKQRFLALVEAGQAHGQFRDDLSAEAIADVFWSTWEGGILRMKIDGNTDQLRASISTLLNTLLKP